MKLVYRVNAMAATALSLSLLLAGCESKTAQCEQLIKVVNAATTDVQTLAQQPTTDKVAQMSKYAELLDKYGKEVGAVELKDAKLVDFRQRFAMMYQGLAKAQRQIIEAVGKKDAKGLQSGIEQLKQGTDQERPIVSEMNTYCGAK
jgi:outer membrane murein-binding lipoprotein Lpp